MGACGPRLTPPLKRPRLVVPNLRQQPRAQSPKKVATPGLEDLKTYSKCTSATTNQGRFLFGFLFLGMSAGFSFSFDVTENFVFFFFRELE